MVFITGPRQVGKTYLATQLTKEFKLPVYLNYDNSDHRQIIENGSWRLDADLVIFDEIHKRKDWKSYLKGIYDTKPKNQSILVTGSARMETFRQSGESLAGRYYHIRLHPLSVKELEKMYPPYQAVEQLNNLGGFPEPFLSNSPEVAARWRNQYFTDLIREDIFDFSRIHEINIMKYLVELLRSRIGSPLSYSSLARDLQASPNTIKKYISILESLFVVFLIRPYHRNIARSLSREPKLYFYDTGYIKGDAGIRLENTSAVCLQKHVHYLHDVKGRQMVLNYLKTKDGKEVDFAIVEDDLPLQMIEIKTSDNTPSRSLIYFSKILKGTQPLQLVHNLRTEQDLKGIGIRNLSTYLASLSS